MRSVSAFADPVASVRAFLATIGTSSVDARVEPRQFANRDRQGWQLDELTGRLVELAGLGAVASLSAVAALVIEAQARSEPVAWISPFVTAFFPPDFADAGIDLAALVVVRTGSVPTMLRAAERLLRSGGFGLVVLDLGPASTESAVSIAAQGRLAGLAQHHDAAIVLITEKPREQASLGAMVSLRAEARRVRSGKGFQISVRSIKDKRRGPAWTDALTALGPPGLT